MRRYLVKHMKQLDKIIYLSESIQPTKGEEHV